jgi:type I restriction enzyme M protein
MTKNDPQKLGRILWNIADDLRGSMNADDFRDYMLAFLFLRYLSDNDEAAAKLDALRTHKRGLMQQLFPSPENFSS